MAEREQLLARSREMVKSSRDLIARSRRLMSDAMGIGTRAHNHPGFDLATPKLSPEAFQRQLVQIDDFLQQSEIDNEARQTLADISKIG